MKTINDVSPNLKSIFEFFLSIGWNQPSSGFVDRYVLEHPDKGHILEVLKFPFPHVAVIDKLGTTILAVGVSVSEINRHYQKANIR